MKTRPDSMAGTSAGTVGGLGGGGALRAAPKKVLTPHTRFFRWFSLSLLFLGPFGFIVGPLMARRGLRKAERLYPQEAGAARRRDQGFSWAQWWVMTPLTVMGAFWVTSVLSGLPMVLVVLWLQLTQ
ncbi:hypothetical protein ACD588_15665 [Xanthomonas campestris pv. campestris]|jgi:hypothetical protein|uniref:hypothetical protein n=1 Tax=Xanthomonas TaxID=338 RepID=UPI002379A556|nr:MULTISPECIES: hypothetical protein [Xanthomonas]MDM7713438.1 hypothetical protein [Xanthomonas campestris pv. campestris]MEA9586905.1 hypothetical protein [Xanthomonas sp. WHRI 10064B]MEA9616096.1 hypothetical protein [Xanthomonas sp. WHRI 10064A]MEB2026096.1 hypothetical protein [Xanthomonas campestris pv. campestris]WDJ77839.1 hypothetical protein JH282_05125 [Xanthomonas campestris pv. campestris]